jgi:hypothetical protein
MSKHKAQKKEMRSFLIFCATLLLFAFVFMKTQVDDFGLSTKECRELNHLWQTKYRVDFRFADTWEVETFDCPSSAVGMAKAMYLLDSNRTMVSGGIQQVDFYAWLKKTDPEIGAKILYKFAGTSDFENNRIDVNMDKLIEGNPVIIANILVHEGRHLEEGYNTHVPCKNDKKLTCDSRLEDNPAKGGAYNYNILFLNQLRYSPKADRTVKRVAKKEMLRLLASKFNEVGATALQKYALD